MDLQPICFHKVFKYDQCAIKACPKVPQSCSVLLGICALTGQGRASVGSGLPPMRNEAKACGTVEESVDSTKAHLNGHHDVGSEVIHPVADVLHVKKLGEPFTDLIQHLDANGCSAENCENWHQEHVKLVANGDE